MPFVFIHGVNTRIDDKNYRKNREARRELIKRLLLKPLAEKDSRFQNMEIVNIYWGKYGVDDKTEDKTLPKVKVLEHLGSSKAETPLSDFELQQLLEASEYEPLQLERLGGNNKRLQSVAVKNLTRFIEAILLPTIFSETNLTEDAENEPEREGILEALLAVAGLEVAKDEDVKKNVIKAGSDEEVMELLKEKIQERFEQLLSDSDLVSSKEKLKADESLERLGGRKRSLPWFDESVERIGELCDRTLNVTPRALTIGFLAQYREKFNYTVSRFIGDVLVYLTKRGSKDSPGEIILEVINKINNVPRQALDEPLIVMTHSMGGNILYDILTFYESNLQVDVWISVGGQVGKFEQMSVFQASGIKIDDGKFDNFKNKVGYWLNIYDPADIFSFKAADIFPGLVEDEVYLTGASFLNPHDTYFKRPSFYRMLCHHLEKVLLNR